MASPWSGLDYLEEIQREDQDEDYSNLIAHLRVEPVLDHVRRLHINHRRLFRQDTPLVFEHLKKVGLAAKRLAQNYHEELESSLYGTNYYARAAHLAGLLHESMLRTGTTFEQLVERSDVTVARTVAAITPDPRIPRPFRYERLANAIGCSGAVSQLVKLADLRHDCYLLLEMVAAKQPGLLDTVGEFCAECRAVLESMHALKEHRMSQRVLAELRRDLKTLQNFCGAPKRRVKRE